MASEMQIATVISAREERMDGAATWGSDGEGHKNGRSI